MIPLHGASCVIELELCLKEMLLSSRSNLQHSFVSY